LGTFESMKSMKKCSLLLLIPKANQSNVIQNNAHYIYILIKLIISLVQFIRNNWQSEL